MNVTLASLFAATLLVPSTASAAPEGIAQPSSGSVDLTGHVGGVSGDGFGGALFGASVLARGSVLAGGATVDASGLFATRYGAAALGGFSYRHDNGFGFDLLGAMGVHHYEGVGRGLLGDDPGISGTLPYAGGRSRLSYQFGQRARRFQLGATATFDADLGRESRSTSYMSTDWFSGNSNAQTSTHAIGFTTAGLMVDLGVAFL